MNSDFNFKRFQWKKLAAWVLCAALAIQSSSVFAATADREESAGAEEIIVLAGVNGDVSGSASVNGDVSGSASVNGDVSGSASVNLSTTGDTRYPYTGKAIKPKVTVKGFTTGKTINAKYYTVTYGTMTNGKFKKTTPKAVGSYYVQVTFKGTYKSFPTRYASFTIVPPTVTIKQITAKSTQLKISWKKASQLKEYEIVISSDKKFKTLKSSYLYSLNNYYTATAKKNATSATIKTCNDRYGAKISVKKLPKGKYFVRIRAKKDNYYGNWSKALSFTVK